MKSVNPAMFRTKRFVQFRQEFPIAPLSFLRVSSQANLHLKDDMTSCYNGLVSTLTKNLTFFMTFRLSPLAFFHQMLYNINRKDD